jgi:hypothetical protein
MYSHCSLYRPLSTIIVVCTSPPIMALPLKTVPPFYEPGALPVVPRLLAQTDLLLESHLPRRLLKSEELSMEPSSGAVRHRYASTRYASSQPYMNAVAFRALSRSPSPQSRSTPLPSSSRKSMRPAKAKQLASNAKPSDDDISDAADASGASDSIHDRHSIQLKIRKPQGQVGRPNSGGYNLEDELALQSRHYKELKVRPYCPH